MKDPLQKKKTHYEILGISETAGKEEIEAAFKKLFISKGDIAKGRAARNDLIDPVKRMLTDILLYQAPYLSQLGFPSTNIERVLTEKRWETAVLWQGNAAQFFVDYASLHSLAVLWYWWAVYLEDTRLAGDAGEPAGTAAVSGAVDPDTAWENAIAYWVFLLNDRYFWSEWAAQRYPEPADVQPVQAELQKSFPAIWSDYAEKYGTAGREEDVRRMRGYEVLFAAEMLTAKQFLELKFIARVDGIFWQVCCGKLLLEKLGKADAVREQLDQAGGKDSKKETLRALRLGLSEFSALAALLKNKNYDEVRAGIRALPKEKRKDPEILNMLAEACLEKGKQLFGSGLYMEALACWREGIDTGKRGREIKKTVIDSCNAKAGTLAAAKPDAAIDLLDQALKIVDDAGLRALLGDQLATKAIGLINDASKAVEKSGGGKEKKEAVKRAVEEVKVGIELLERSVSLGCKRADDNMEAARNLLEYLNSDYISLSDEELELIKKADQLAAADDFDSAILLLEKLCTPEAGEFVRQRLAQCLNARAVQKINAAIGSGKLTPNSGKGSLDKALRKVCKKPGASGWLVLVLLLGFMVYSIAGGKPYVWLAVALAAADLLRILFRSLSFASKHSGNMVNSIFGRTKCEAGGCSSGASYTVNSSKYGTVYLCSKHVNAVEKLASPKINVGAAIKNNLNQAVSDLERALRLYPGFSQARENLNQTRTLLDNIN